MLFAIIGNVNKSIDEFKAVTEETHKNKLHKLGIQNEIAPCNPDNVIFNFSSHALANRTKFLLAFGLDFCLPIYKLDFYKYFLAFEKLVYVLTNDNCANFREFKELIKTLSYKYFYNFKSYKIFSCVFKKGDISLLRTLASNKDIIVTRPDKGNGIVILNRSDYIRSVTSIISDTSRFLEITEPISKFCIKVEDKVNNFLRKLKNSKFIDESLYKELFVSGSGPGILYGLPKVHKSDFHVRFQMRPIFAAFNNAAFKVAKYLVKILEPLTRNSYTVDNSCTFISDISKVSNANNFFMASFDIENLFTNVPLNETIDICLNGLFLNSNYFLGYTRTIFKICLKLLLKIHFFYLMANTIDKLRGWAWECLLVRHLQMHSCVTMSQFGLTTALVFLNLYFIKDTSMIHLSSFVTPHTQQCFLIILILSTLILNSQWNWKITINYHS